MIEQKRIDAVAAALGRPGASLITLDGARVTVGIGDGPGLFVDAIVAQSPFGYGATQDEAFDDLEQQAVDVSAARAKQEADQAIVAQAAAVAIQASTGKEPAPPKPTPKAEPLEADAVEAKETR